MSFAGATVANRDDVLAAADVLRAGQFQHQRLVERGDRGELEAVEAFDRREPGFLDPPFDSPAFPFNHLQLSQTQQVARIVDLLARALARQLVVLAQEGRQAEGFQVVGEQNLRRIAHDAAPAIRLK